MPLPSLIVGIGGTGQWIVTNVKKSLLDMHGSFPTETVKLVAFDTTTSAEAVVGGEKKEDLREVGSRTGAVSLDVGEYFHIGGDVHHLSLEIAKGEQAHIGSWFMADWYLRNLSRSMFNITQGAGQFRQFGRMAVFYDVQSPSNSTIHNVLSDAIGKLKRENPTAKELNVFLCGSVAGGTGAGMFVDLAHLIRQIAGQQTVDMNITLTGYLVLPEAFAKNVDPGVLRSMYARSYAAMRENRRFAVHIEYEKGYPMIYHGGGGDPVWHGSIKTKLFDSLRYIDGQRDRQPLSTVSMNQGVAPTIADAITASIDGSAGETLRQHLVNVEAEANARRSRGDILAGEALFGSVGTYSIVLPIHQMIEGWAHRLGLDLINTLVKPIQIDNGSGLPTQLAADQNDESPNTAGQEDASTFFKSATPAAYIDDQVEQTLFIGELFRIGREANSNRRSALVGELMSKDIAAWNQTFIPNATDADTMRVKQRVEVIVEEQFSTEVRTSDQYDPQENSALGAERILDEARIFKNRYLGTEDPKTGQRSGGQFQRAMDEFKQYHVNRFVALLQLKQTEALNGRHQNPTIAKGGKLGYLKSFLEGAQQELFGCEDILDQVRESRQKMGDRRKNAQSNAHFKGQQMEKTGKEEKGMFDFGRTFKGAVQAQKDFIRSEEELIDIYRVERTEQTVLAAVRGMLSYISSALDSIQSWSDALAFDRRGLIGQLNQGLNQLEAERIANQSVVVREVISDPKFEEERFNHYLTQGDRNRQVALMDNFRWSLTEELIGGEKRARLNLAIIDSADALTEIETDEFSNNLQRLLSMTRKPFQNALQIESVGQYLMEHRYRGYEGAIELAEQVYQSSGPLLNFDGGGSLPANYLITTYNDENPQETGYLTQLIQRIAQRSGASTSSSGGDNKDNFVRFTNSEDRFSMTFVWMLDLVELEKMSSFKRGRQDYLGANDESTRGDRRLLHIFPAEVNAAYFENRLPELQQGVRIFSDDITLQLENPERVKLFLLLYTYGMIDRGFKRDKSGSDLAYWRLTTPPQRELDEFGNVAKPEEIYLTQLGDGDLLNALKTFNHHERDVREGEGILIRIDYDRVQKALAEVRESVAQERIESDLAGQFSKDFKQDLALLESDPISYADVHKEIARLDGIRQSQLRFEEGLPKLKNVTDLQDEYDLMSIFVLILNDEVSVMRKRISSRIESARRVEEINPTLSTDHGKQDTNRKQSGGFDW